MQRERSWSSAASTENAHVSIDRHTVATLHAVSGHVLLAYNHITIQSHTVRYSIMSLINLEEGGHGPTSWQAAVDACKSDDTQLMGLLIISPKGVLSYSGCIRIGEIMSILDIDHETLIADFMPTKEDLEVMAQYEHIQRTISVPNFAWVTMLSLIEEGSSLISTENGIPKEDARFRVNNMHQFVL